MKYIGKGVMDGWGKMYEDKGKWEEKDYEGDVSEMEMGEFLLG